MANQSIYNAFDRMWQHVTAAVGKKSDIDHSHEDLQEAIDNKADASALNNKQDKLTFDNTPTANSSNPVTSGGIKAELDKKADATELDNKQDKLTFDSTPTTNSSNPVTSGGIKSYVDGKVYTHPEKHPASMIDGLAAVATSGSYNDLTNKPTIPAAVTVDSSISSSSTNPVQNKVVKAELDKKADATELDSKADVSALNAKQDKLTFDSTPTASSNNPVTSGGIKTALDTKQDKLTFDSAPTASSNNPVTSGGVKAELDKKADATELESKADLDANGKVPTSQLPSYVDDVIEGTYVSSASFKNTSGTAITGETGKIYVDTTSNKTYRWSGSAFVEISASLALGETSSTAYRGDRGKTAYEHSQTPHAPSDAEKNQNAFSNIAVSGQTTVSADTATDTITLVAGSNVTITTDATNDKVTIAASHPTVSKSTDTTSSADPEHGLTFTAVDSITRDGNGHVTKINTKTVTLPDAGLHYVDSSSMTVVAGSSTSGSYLAAKWSIANVDGITTPTDGMSISLRTPDAGYSGGIVLSIDGGSKYYPIVRNVNSLVTTTYSAGSTLILTFNPTQTASPYLTAGTATTVTGCWQIADYDSNTKTSSGTSNKSGTKMYLVGGTSQSSSGVTTYTNSKVYIGTDNCLYSNGSKVALASEIPDDITVDSALSDSSENPVQNKVVKAELDAKLNQENPEVSGSLHIANLAADWYGSLGVSVTGGEIRFETNNLGEDAGIIAGLADPVSDDYAANKGYVDTLTRDTHKGVKTSGSGSAYTATVTNISSLEAGVSFIMVPHTASTTKTPTLNVNSLGAKSLKRQTSNVSGTLANGYADSWLGANMPVQVIYNGTYWVVQGMTQCNPYDLSTAVPVTKGGTGVTSLEELASSLRSYLYTYGTEDLVAGESDLETGKIYFVYE